MEPSPQQDKNPEQPSTPPGLASRKVLQPSASFAEEMKASQQTAPIPAPPQSTPQPSPTSIQPQQPPGPARPLYPTPITGQGVPQPLPSSANTAVKPEATNPKSNTKVLAVRIVAGIIIVLNAINAYNWILLQRAGYNNIIYALQILVMLALAIGIFMLSEAARAAFVVVSAIILIVSSYGIFQIVRYNTVGNTAAADAFIEQRRQSLEKSLHTEAPSLTPEQNEKRLQTIRKQLDALSGSPAQLKVKRYISTGILLITAVGPLVFFTRPSIKEVFG